MHRGVGEGGDLVGVADIGRRSRRDAPPRLGDRVELVDLEGHDSSAAEAVECDPAWARTDPPLANMQ